MKGMKNIMKMKTLLLLLILMNLREENIMNPKFRETFGIVDPKTKQKYKDVLKSFLILRRNNWQDLASSTVFPNPHSANSYQLHADAKVRRIINREGDCPCIVSFQTRRVGKIKLFRILHLQDFMRLREQNEKEPIRNTSRKESFCSQSSRRSSI